MGEHGCVQHVHGEHYQRNVLRVFATEGGLVGNPESSLVNRRSPKSINQSPNSKFLACPCRLESGLGFLVLEASLKVVGGWGGGP